MAFKVAPTFLLDPLARWRQIDQADRKTGSGVPTPTLVVQVQWHELTALCVMGQPSPAAREHRAGPACLCESECV